MTSPKPITRAGGGVGVLLRGLEGAPLASVAYRFLPGADESGYVWSGELVDMNITALALTLADGRGITITWAMDGELEGLSAVANGTYKGEADAVVDVSRSPAWGDLIGESIESVSGAWHVSGERCPEALYAIRLQFPRSAPVVALGTAEDDVIRYMPDELVAVFDAELAHAYHPLHACESAWGSQLHQM